MAAEGLDPSLAHIKPPRRTLSTPMVITTVSNRVRNTFLVTRNGTRAPRLHHRTHANITGTGTLRLIIVTMIRFPAIPERTNTQHTGLHAQDEHPTLRSPSPLNNTNLGQPRPSRHQRQPTLTHGALAFPPVTHSRIGTPRRSRYYFLAVSLMPTHSANGSTTGLLPGTARPHPSPR